MHGILVWRHTCLGMQSESGCERYDGAEFDETRNRSHQGFEVCRREQVGWPTRYGDGCATESAKGFDERSPRGGVEDSGKRRVYNVRRRLHGHPRVDFGQIDTKNTFTRPRTDIVRRAVRFPVQLALDSRLRGMTDRTNVQHNGVSRGLGSAHRCRLLNESKAVYRFVSRRLTFHTSPHLVHRQYVDAVTTLLVVVSSVDRQAGHADGVVTGSSASLRFVFG